MSGRRFQVFVTGGPLSDQHIVLGGGHARAGRYWPLGPVTLNKTLALFSGCHPVILCSALGLSLECSLAGPSRPKDCIKELITTSLTQSRQH